MSTNTTYDVHGLINPDWPDHPVTGRYADTFWLPRLGPAATALLRWITYQPDHKANISLVELSTVLGLSRGTASTRSLERSIDRLRNHGLARLNATTLELSLTVPTLSARQLQPLDERTKALHTRLLEGPNQYGRSQRLFT